MSRLAHHLMNLISNEIFLYTSEEAVNVFVKKEKIHIAPNSIMYKSECNVGVSANRKNLIYSGRLEKSKNLENLVSAFISSQLWNTGSKLIIIGDGSCHNSLQLIVSRLRFTSYIEFHGEISDVNILGELYSSARMAVGPGYGGLNIVQANSFGVPIVLDKFSDHAPEIALVKFNGIIKTDFTSIENMERAIKLFYEVFDWDLEKRRTLATNVSQVYCISNMVNAFVSEIRNQLRN